MDKQSPREVDKIIYKTVVVTGLHGANGLSPEVSYQIYKIYVIPRLLYGFEIIPLNKTQLEKINRYHVKTLRNLQSLPQYICSLVPCLLKENFIKDF